MKNARSTNRGFTIVELLVTIVVIGIIAAITIVAYNEIQGRAAVVVLKSDLDTASAQLANDNLKNGSYPANVNVANYGNGLSKSAGTIYQYNQDSTSYCLSATSAKAGNSVFHVSSSKGVIEDGICSITNLILNPSFEVTTDWTSTGGDYVVHNSNAKANFGTYSGVRTVNHAWGIWGEYFQHDYVVTPGATYTLSAYSLINIGAVNISTILVAVQDDWTWIVSNTPHDNYGSWTRYSITWTQPVGQTIVRICLNANGDDTSVGTWYWDGVMLTQGSTVYNYADGNSPGWVWNGTPNASTSTGPVI